jgi:hypothetical protein
MTINVALVTSEALIIGCDSTASRSDYYIDPFQIGIEVDQAGGILHDADGRMNVKFKFDQMEHIVIDAWGGVTKMFLLSDKYCHVAAVTAGTASLNQRLISSLASDYRALCSAKKASQRKRTVRGVAEEFLAFVKAEYDEHYKSSNLPPQLRDGPEFLIGGIGQNDKFPCSYRVRVKENDVDEEFASGASGLSWNAQSDAVERIMRGYDRKLRGTIENTFRTAIKNYQDEMNAAVLRILDDVLNKLNCSMPDGVDTTLPSAVTVSPPWDSLKLGVPYSALPLQEAINFVSYLIMMQAGKSRFAPGLATVGGRIHIGVITKDQGFTQINEPTLTHHYTGFQDDR